MSNLSKLYQAAKNGKLNNAVLKNLVDCEVMDHEEADKLRATNKQALKDIRNGEKSVVARDLRAFVNREGMAGHIEFSYSEEHGMSFASGSGESRLSVNFPKTQNDRLAILARIIKAGLESWAAAQDSDEETAAVSEPVPLSAVS